LQKIKAKAESKNEVRELANYEKAIVRTHQTPRVFTTPLTLLYVTAGK